MVAKLVVAKLVAAKLVAEELVVGPLVAKLLAAVGCCGCCGKDVDVEGCAKPGGGTKVGWKGAG